MAAGKNIIIRPPTSKVNFISTFDKSLEIIKPIHKERKKDNFLRRFNRRIQELKIKLQEQQRLEKHQTIEKQLVEESIVSGSISNLRDEEGNIILFEDIAEPTKNIKRRDQCISVELYNDIFDIDAAINVIDFSIVELKNVDNRITLLDEFLKTFRTILSDIPNEDLQFIFRRGIEEQSGELIDPDEFDRLTEGNFSTIIQRLIDCQDQSLLDINEIEGLSIQVDSLTTQLEAMGNLVLEASTNDAGLNLPTLIKFVANELRRRKIIAGDIEVPQQKAPSIIKVRAHRFLENTLGEELNRTDEFNRFIDDESDRDRLIDDETGGSSRFSDRFRNPKDLERDEQRRRKQQREKNKQRQNVEKIINEERNFNKKRQVEVTFLTAFSEATTLRMTIPFNVRVPTLTNIHGFPEEVTGVRFKLNAFGDFKGWFKDDGQGSLKVTETVEYVTGKLEPGTRFTLKVAFERFDNPNRNIPDDRFPSPELSDNFPLPEPDNVQVVTLPEPEPIPADDLDVIMPPMKDLKPKIGMDTPKDSGLNLNPDPTPPRAGDPDEPIFPLDENEVEIVNIEEEKIKMNRGLLISSPIPPPISVIDVTPIPIINKVIDIPQILQKLKPPKKNFDIINFGGGRSGFGF